MTRTCKRCRRVNPREALFCYHDGALLEGAVAGGDVPPDGSAVNVGARPFSSPFLLASGRACHNFNQLALACHADLAGALGLLREGRLEAFLRAEGRADLAAAARAATRATDPARGLDDFLGRLPAATLLPPRLRVEPAVLDLVTLRAGEDRRLVLTLHNEGMRLLVGSADCGACPWLGLGGGPPLRQKVFQLSGKAVLPVRLLGRHLRAYHKPQEAEVRLESNGGTVLVAVRVNVPVRPFPEGVLAGAVTPRQLAEKARASPKQAAALVESGAVGRWYQDNGWDYPVSGPAVAGVAALQQYFEALGLVKPPRVELSEDAIRLHGGPGETVEYVLAVITQENRLAVAHGTSDRPWLRVGPAISRGRSSFLPLAVPAVPGHPGDTLHATVAVVANGNQRFAVPVTLTVVERRPAVVPAPPPAPPRPAAAAVPVAVASRAAPAPAPPLAPEPTLIEPVARAAAPQPPPPTGPTHGLGWLTVVPAVLLAVAMLGAVLRDYLAPTVTSAAPPEEVVDSVPRIDIRFHDLKKDDELEQVYLNDPEPTLRFGLVELYRGKEVGTDVNVRRLTFDQWGRTNNTCLRFDDGDERLFGGPRGRWEERAAKSWKEEGKTHHGVKSTWVCDDLKVEVIQFVELVRGEQSNLLDTCRVRYRIENRDGKPHRVGIRFLLDSFIGGNDGVPFTIPGESDLCDTLKDLPAGAKDKKLPDFLQALEKPDLAHPGTVAHLRLKLELPDHKAPLESPVRVTLGAWPNEKLRVLDRKAGGPLTLWDVPVLPMKSLGLNDSALVIYWQEQPLLPGPGAAREVGFEYGLWSLARQGSRLAATVDGSFRPGGELTVVAYVNQAGRGDETATLTLPDEFKLLAGDETQSVPRPPEGTRGGNRPVTWKVRAGPSGKYALTVKTGSGQSQTIPVEIKSAIFD
jgi:hypothetical protein